VDFEQALAIQTDGIEQLYKSVQSLHAHASDDWAAKRVLDVLEADEKNVRIHIAKRLHDVELEDASEKRLRLFRFFSAYPYRQVLSRFKEHHLNPVISMKETLALLDSTMLWQQNRLAPSHTSDPG
jgi:hypothetical protein